MNNNSDYQKAYNYIKNYNKKTFMQACCCSTRGTIGPTGPTGPQGPSTITVGTTTQGLPGSVPSVVNAGTNENAILNFVIPAGPTGPQGEIGPTGPTETYKSVNNKFQIITITEIMVLFCSKLLPLSSHQFLSYL